MGTSVQFRYSKQNSRVLESAWQPSLSHPRGPGKAVIRKAGWPTTIKTFRLKKDADDWSRRTEDEMVRGLFIQRGSSERMTFEAAMKRDLADVTPTKRPLTQAAEKSRSRSILASFGKYSLAAITTELIAEYRDARLAGEDRMETSPR
ncbi:hypothetical protein HSX11_13710 [Oxalobacteraceae bacterium]|nr:hypothetical protein [Oxalobacteraceae bacterium]